MAEKSEAGGAGARDAELMAAAQAVRARAYAPYSGFYVGAAVLDAQGRIHVGCNMENSSYPEGICAEANALGSMVAAGGTRIVAIAVSGGPGEALADCSPCGGCRQRIWEFAESDTPVLMSTADGGTVKTTAGALLPGGFRL